MSDAIVKALVQTFETGDGSLMAPYVAPGAQTWHNHDGLDMDTLESFNSLGILRSIVDDLRLDVVEQAPLPDGLVLRVVMRGTVKASGAELAGNNCLFLRTNDGKITRIEEYVDPTFGDQLAGG